jgi:hypothetical protein
MLDYFVDNDIQTSQAYPVAARCFGALTCRFCCNCTVARTADATARANGWRYSFEPRPMGRKRRILGMDYVQSLSRPFPTTVAIVTQFLAVEILR